MCSNMTYFKRFIVLNWNHIFFPLSKLSYFIWCCLMLLNVSDLLRSECMLLHFKKRLPMSTNMLIWKYRFAYTSDLPSLFSISDSLFVKDLKVCFKSIANLASFEAKEHLFTQQKYGQHRCHGFTALKKREITKL